MPSKSSSSPSSRSKSSSAAQPERKLSLLLLLIAAHQRMIQLVDRELAANGVDTGGHYAALSMIGAFGPLRLTELAAELGLPLTTASDVVRRLESAGHVLRRPNPEDGRSFLFELSARGDREWRRGWGALQRVNEQLAHHIDEESMRQALSELGTAFEAALTET